MIVVRSLREVGGIRTKARFTRRANRAARERGFPTFKALVAYTEMRMKQRIAVMPELR